MESETRHVTYRLYESNVSHVSLTRSLVLFIIPVPPKISPFTADRDLHLGERTTLTCSVTRGDLPLSITWLKDGRSMGPSERVTVTNMDQYNSILMIESLSPDHNGNYSCVARNVAAEVSHTQRLVVHGNPPLGPLQFARRPPDSPTFACARVCVCCARASPPARCRPRENGTRERGEREYNSVAHDRRSREFAAINEANVLPVREDRDTRETDPHMLIHVNLLEFNAPRAGKGIRRGTLRERSVTRPRRRRFATKERRDLVACN